MRKQRNETILIWRFCQGMFDLGGIIFSTSRDQIRGEWQSIDPYYHRSSRLSLLPWLLSTTNWFPAIIILPHKVKHLFWYQRVKLFVVISISWKIEDAGNVAQAAPSGRVLVLAGGKSSWRGRPESAAGGEKLPLWRGWAELGWCGEGAGGLLRKSCQPGRGLRWAGGRMSSKNYFWRKK